MTLSARGRRSEILLLAHSTGLASVEELSARFGVTASTIRRDLARLRDEGKIARTYGGAMALASPAESDFNHRNQVEPGPKHAIGLYARRLLEDGDSILLEAGSTVASFASHIDERLNLTVVTNSLAVLRELADIDSVHVECLGGTLRHLSQGFVGPLAEYSLERMTFDTVFFGADGVEPTAICEADLRQTRLKEMASARAHKTVVLADSTKLGAAPFHAWAQLPTGWTLVTDDGADPQKLAPFYEAGVDVRLAPQVEIA